MPRTEASGDASPAHAWPRSRSLPASGARGSESLLSAPSMRSSAVAAPATSPLTHKIPSAALAQTEIITGSNFNMRVYVSIFFLTQILRTACYRRSSWSREEPEPSCARTAPRALRWCAHGQGPRRLTPPQDAGLHQERGNRRVDGMLRPQNTAGEKPPPPQFLQHPQGWGADLTLLLHLSPFSLFIFLI